MSEVSADYEIRGCTLPADSYQLANPTTPKENIHMSNDEALRRHVIELLKSGHAHVDFESVIKEWKPEFRGSRAVGFNHSPWQLIEHLRISQWDILEFSKSADHVSPEYPHGYWPDGEAPPDEATWDRSVEQFRRDHESMQSLVLDTSVDLFLRLPHGDGQTLLKEALTLADHNAYHIGQLMVLRKYLGV